MARVRAVHASGKLISLPILWCSVHDYSPLSDFLPVVWVTMDIRQRDELRLGCQLQYHTKITRKLRLTREKSCAHAYDQDLQEIYSVVAHSWLCLVRLKLKRTRAGTVSQSSIPNRLPCCLRA